MSSAFADSVGTDVDDPPRSGPATRPFDDDGYLGYDPRLPSQRFDPFSTFAADNDSPKGPASDDVSSPIYAPPPYVAAPGDNGFPLPSSLPETPSTNPIYGVGSSFSPDPLVFSSFSPQANGEAFEAVFAASDGPILPPPAEMEPEEEFILREWRRQNAILLEEKEKREKELVNELRDEADEFKMDFQRRRKISCETNKANNREKEKLAHIITARQLVTTTATLVTYTTVDYSPSRAF